MTKNSGNVHGLKCAFMNTPKYQQVHGKGHIVCKEWIEQCHARRARLPWRRHALDKREQNKPESEDEILEEVPQSPIHVPVEVPVESGSEQEMVSGTDTDEEIERVQANANHCGSGSDTDVEEPEKPSDTSSLPWPPLPDAFINTSFFLRPEDHRHHKLICRYIIANGGNLNSDQKQQLWIIRGSLTK